MNQQASTNASNNTGIVGSLVGLGAEWAVFGLRCATSALEQSSRSMRLAAESLATLARELDERLPADDVAAGPGAETIDTTGELAPEPTVTADPSQL